MIWSAFLKTHFWGRFKFSKRICKRPEISINSNGNNVIESKGINEITVSLSFFNNKDEFIQILENYRLFSTLIQKLNEKIDNNRKINILYQFNSSS